MMTRCHHIDRFYCFYHAICGAESFLDILTGKDRANISVTGKTERFVHALINGFAFGRISHVSKEYCLNIKAYLERINYQGSLAPTAETLRRLQVAHLLAVPFENLSIHAREPIVLEDDALFTKIVEQRRGGFCYEANGLFAALLRALGFDVEMLSAEVAEAEGGFGPAFDHMALMVTLKERWLVDVGFGDSFIEPLLLDERGEQAQGEHVYRIVPDDAYLILMRREDGDEWKAQYRFTLREHQYADYAEMCRFHQTSPQSHFTRARICSRATEEGRVTLSEMRFITTTRNGGRHERTLTSQEEYAAVLREFFDISMKG
jgi:N-hydroxyarylamine O-acetyltransferase